LREQIGTPDFRYSFGVIGLSLLQIVNLITLLYYFMKFIVGWKMMVELVRDDRGIRKTRTYIRTCSGQRT